VHVAAQLVLRAGVREVRQVLRKGISARTSPTRLSSTARPATGSASTTTISKSSAAMSGITPWKALPLTWTNG
jgi:hypothetical protein